MKNASDFIQRATEKFGKRFDYSDVDYLRAKSPVTISCPAHGLFFQSPFDHLRSVYGCSQCFNALRGKNRKPSTTQKPHCSPEAYLRRVVLPPRYSIDMSRFVGITAGEVGVCCPTHGVQWEPPRSILVRSYPCSKCGQARAHPTTKSYSNFLEEASKAHGPVYSYTESEYINRKSVLSIKCGIHGIFTKSAQKHLAGQGCPTCLLLRNIQAGLYPGGYSEEFFRKNPAAAETTGLLYYFKVGRRYKIGITAGPVNKRAASVRSQSRQLVEVIAVRPLPMLEAYREEQNILDTYQENRIYRKWSTELFDIDILGLDF